MPKGSAQERLDNIRAEGAEASITDLNYDEAVRLANSQAQQKGWVMVQDTAWEGYEDIPTWIMQGYGTMGLEAIEQLPEKPTHIFLQAGVGSMSGAVAGLFAEMYGENIKFCKFDTTKARRVAIREKVLGLPTIAIYKDGAKIDEVTKDDATVANIEAMIKKYL